MNSTWVLCLSTIILLRVMVSLERSLVDNTWVPSPLGHLYFLLTHSISVGFPLYQGRFSLDCVGPGYLLITPLREKNAACDFFISHFFWNFFVEFVAIFISLFNTYKAHKYLMVKKVIYYCVLEIVGIFISLLLFMNFWRRYEESWICSHYNLPFFLM